MLCLRLRFVFMIPDYIAIALSPPSSLPSKKKVSSYTWLKMENVGSIAGPGVRK